MTSAWYLPFGFPATLLGDHQALGVTFDIDILFGNKLPDIPTPPIHGVHSNNMPKVQKFNDMVTDVCQDANMFETINCLYCRYIFSPEDHQTLKQLDCTLTKILIDADKKCQLPNRYPWSPELHKAFLTHQYWTL